MDLQLNKDEDAEYGNDNNGTTTNDTPVYLNPTEGEGDGNDADNHNNANTDLPDHSNNKPPPHLADDPATGPGKRLKTAMSNSSSYPAAAGGASVSESKKDRNIRVMLERLAKIEHDFSDSKQELYRSKVKSLQEELVQIQQGTHPQFAERVELLERERQALIEKAELWRDYQLQRAQEIYQQEIDEAEQEYTADRDGLRDRMLQQIEERKKKLKEERENMVIDSDLITDSSSRTQAGIGRKLRKRIDATTTDRPGGRKRQAQGPSMVFMLKESEILEDMFIMSKMNTGRKGGLPKRNRNR